MAPLPRVFSDYSKDPSNQIFNGRECRAPGIPFLTMQSVSLSC